MYYCFDLRTNIYILYYYLLFYKKNKYDFERSRLLRVFISIQKVVLSLSKSRCVTIDY